MSSTYTQVYLSAPFGVPPQRVSRQYMTAWIPSDKVRFGKLIKVPGKGTWKIEEIYSSFRKELVEKYPKDFHNVIACLEGEE